MPITIRRIITSVVYLKKLCLLQEFLDIEGPTPVFFSNPSKMHPCCVICRQTITVSFFFVIMSKVIVWVHKIFVANGLKHKSMYIFKSFEISLLWCVQIQM